MGFEILRDLRDLHVQVIHAPDAEGLGLVEHVQRIGCTVEAAWPIPDGLAVTADLVLLAIDHDSRDRLRRLLRAADRIPPTLIAIVGYENPSILQLVLEAGAHAVVERPIRPFGLLTQMTLARALWLEQQETRRRVLKLERKLSGLHKIQRAKAILMDTHGMTEDQAYQAIRRQAMTKRMGMEELASAIVSANDLLNSARRSG